MKPYDHLPTSHNALRVFESVARHMSFTKAAEELFVTQSAVSRQIKQLEDDLSASLVIRHHRTIELTDKGSELFEALRQNYQSLNAILASWKSADRKRIVIKSALSYATRVLLPKVNQLHERYPDHEIVIIPSVEEDPVLEAEDCDLLIINTRNPHLYQNRKGVSFLRDEYMAPVYSELMSPSQIELKDILSLPHLHATLNHQDWKVWSTNAQLTEGKVGRDTVFFSLDLALSACLSGQGVTVTDLLLVLPELKRQFLKCPQGITLQHSDWQYYCYLNNSTEIASQVLNWLAEETKSEVEQLNSICHAFGWKNEL